MPASDEDNNLLERLNALKKSSVSFETEKNPLQRPPIPEPLTGPRTEPPSPTLSDLLADLGPEEEWHIDGNEEEQIQSLLKEAKAALPTDHNSTTDTTETTKNGRSKNEKDGTGVEKEDEEVTDAEAAREVARILDSLEIVDEEKEPISPPPPEPKERDKSPKPLDLPSTPQTLPPPASITSNELHLPSVPLALPSAPTTLPTTPLPSSAGKGYTAEEVDSWCIICLADAEVRCTGCAGDLYCLGCWREGHVGEGVGREERGHKWVAVKGQGEGGGEIGGWEGDGEGGTGVRCDRLR